MSHFTSKTEDTKSYIFAVSHEEMNSKRRNTMEDCHRILNVLDSELPNYSYFGIYDGHGGRQLVDFLEDALEANISKELKLTDDASILERLSRAFLITDMQSKKLNINTSGATAVSVLLYNEEVPDEPQGKRILYVANVGDARAVLVSTKYPENKLMELPRSRSNSITESNSGYIATRLTFDHKAEDIKEQERIKEAGGFVTRNRVLGILAVSRSFGDHGMKDFVIAAPYVTETDLNLCGDCPILILACDGVWDVFTDQEAADLLLERYKKEGPFKDAAHCLVTAAIEKGSADNVTVIVVFL